MGAGRSFQIVFLSGWHRGNRQAARAGAAGSRLLDLAPRLFAVVLAAVLAALIIVNWNRWLGSAATQRTDDAYLQADLTPLSAQVAGRIKRMAVDDFQRV